MIGSRGLDDIRCRSNFIKDRAVKTPRSSIKDTVRVRVWKACRINLNRIHTINNSQQHTRVRIIRGLTRWQASTNTETIVIIIQERKIIPPCRKRLTLANNNNNNRESLLSWSNHFPNYSLRQFPHRTSLL